MTAKEQVKERVFKCKACGKIFSGDSPRREQIQHYADNPTHDPKGGRAAASGAQAIDTSTDLILRAIKKATLEINEKRAMLQKMEEIRSEITQLENRIASLQKLLPPTTV